MKIIKYIFIKQDDLKDCGISSLLMIIKTYKGNCSKEYLRWLTNTDVNGVTAYDLVEAAKKFNFNSYGFSKKIEEIDKNDLPIISHVIINNQYKHFIVIYKLDLKRKRILIADPSDNIKYMTIDEFNSITTNNYIYLKPYKKILSIKNNNSLINIIKNIFKSNKYIIILVLLLSVLVSFLTCFNSYIFKFILDKFNTVFDNLYIFIFIVFILLFTKIFLNIFKYFILIKLNNKLDFSVFKNVYEKIISLPYIYFKNRSTGEVMTRVNDLEIIKSIFTTFITSIILDIILIIVAIIFILLINYNFIYILFFVFIYSFLLFIILRNRVKYNLNLLKKEKENVNNLFYTSILNIESIRNLNINNIFINKFNLNYNKYIKTFNKYNVVYFILDIFFEFLDGITLILTIVCGLFMIKYGYITITDLIVISNLLNIINTSLFNIIDFLFSYINAMTSINRIKELCDINFDIINTDYNKKINNIYVNNLSYGYTYNNNCLNNINLELKENDKVLLTGKSGNGKSTLIKLLMGYLNYDKGCILINDVDLNYLGSKYIKNKITLVSQNENIFPFSIKENILMGRDIDEDKFNKICSLLNIEDILNKNNLTYDYKIDENGFNLSGGQKQRIILARSLLKNSDVYIFDESFCNLDIKSERNILMNILNYLNDKIVIVVSHRYNNKDLFNKLIKI